MPLSSETFGAAMRGRPHRCTEWRFGGEIDRNRAVLTRKALLDHKALLDQLMTDKTPLVGFHLAWPGLGIVERSGNAYRFIPL